MGNIYKPLLASCLLLVSLSATARDYAVEMIIFERTSSESDSEEIWDFSVNKISEKLQNLEELSTSSVKYNVSPRLSRLSRVSSELNGSGYRVLTSASWVQPGSAHHLAPVISLGNESSALAHAFVQIYKTSLIFVNLDLHFIPNPVLAYSTTSPDSAEAGSSDPDGDSTDNTGANDNIPSDNIPNDNIMVQREVLQPQYFLSEKRRLKFKEIHYFDHPKFGAILGIWPRGG